MSFDLERADDYDQNRLMRLEARYRRAQFVLTGAQTAYASLREALGVTELQLHHAWQRVQRAQEQLIDAQSAIELEEDQHYAPRSMHRGVR